MLGGEAELVLHTKELGYRKCHRGDETAVIELICQHQCYLCLGCTANSWPGGHGSKVLRPAIRALHVQSACSWACISQQAKTWVPSITKRTLAS